MGATSKVLAQETRHGSLAALSGFVAGVAIAAVILFVDWLFAPSRWSEAGGFLGAPETLVWLALLSAQAGLWVVAILASRTTQQIGLHGRSRPVALVGFGLLALLLLPIIVVPAVTAPLATPLPSHRVKILLFIAFGILAAAPWILAMWRIGTTARVLSELARSGEDGWQAQLAPTGGHPFDGYLRLRELLSQSVGVLGVIVTGLTLTTGALRIAVLAWDDKAKFPIESVLVYGGFFSLLLGLIYLPVQLRLLELGRHLRDWAAPVKLGDDWEPAFKLRAEAEGVLRLGADPVAGLQTGLAILAPLATALVGVLLAAD